MTEQGKVSIGENYTFDRDVETVTFGFKKGTLFTVTAINSLHLKIKLIKGNIELRNHGMYKNEFYFGKHIKYGFSVENGLGFKDIEVLAKEYGYKNVNDLPVVPVEYIVYEDLDYPFSIESK